MNDAHTTSSHVHRDDCPEALGVLAALFARKHPASLKEIGYEATAEGAWVDWDKLEDSWLSSTELAAVVVARGITAAERHGGWPPHVSQALVRAVSHLRGTP